FRGAFSNAHASLLWTQRKDFDGSCAANHPFTHGFRFITFTGLKNASFYSNFNSAMTLDEATKQIRLCGQKMNDFYGNVVFDEWVVISLAHHKARILFYVGPRNDDFLKNFAADLGSLRTALLESKFNIGDFEFARH